MKLIVLGVRVIAKSILSDDVAEPLALDIEARIKKATEQIVKDMSHASGREMTVEFN